MLEAWTINISDLQQIDLGVQESEVEVNTAACVRWEHCCELCIKIDLRSVKVDAWKIFYYYY
jgi:hypothetical protein